MPNDLGDVLEIAKDKSLSFDLGYQSFCNVSTNLRTTESNPFTLERYFPSMLLFSGYLISM